MGLGGVGLAWQVPCADWRAGWKGHRRLWGLERAKSGAKDGDHDLDNWGSLRTS